MNAAQRVVEKFGGQTKVAEIIGKGQPTVHYWTTTGMIPAKWHGTLLQAARDRGIELTAAEFLPVTSSTGPVEAKAKTKKSNCPPIAEYMGTLPMGDVDLPCFVLDDGRRVISRTGATSVLAGKKGGGQLEKYARASGVREYIPEDLHEKMIDFSIPEVVNKTVRGIDAETFLDLCRGYVRALHENNDALTITQREMAWKASAFLASCAKVGLIALIDEVTGYQYDRAQDALRVKLKAFLAEEMRKWEKTFPDELWMEFGRLTRWRGSVIQRPKYWGRLVIELIYEYLDPDVAKWLKENAPKPRHRQNYHQWLSDQYGLKKLLEHIWMVIGMARACQNLRELKEKMAETFGRNLVTMTVHVPVKTETPLLPFMSEGAASEPGKNGESAASI